MYDEDQSVARWVRWIVPLTIFSVVVTMIGAWYYINRPQRGPWSKTVEQNLAIVRDHSRRETERRLAADTLEHGDASIVPELMAELTQGDALSRELAALTLGRLGEKASAAVEALTAALNDPAPLVRERAVTALGRVSSHPKTIVDALQRSVHDSDPTVRDRAFELLRRQQALGIKALADLLHGLDADVRRRAVIELGQMGREADRTRTALRAAKDDSDPLVRAEALAALVKPWALGPEELAQFLDDPDAVVRSTAFRLLHQMGPRAEPVVPRLIDRLQMAFQGGDFETAGTIARILGAIGPAARSATDVLLEHAPNAPHPADVWVRVALQRISLEGEFELPELLERAEAAGDELKSLILWDLPSQKKPRADRRLAAPPEYVIADADLAHLSGLKNLELLNLNQTAIGDAGLAHLAGLTRLKTLHLWNTKVTSVGLVHLANMRQLRSLSLAECAITDDGLRQLRGLTQIESLDLYGTRVTDAGMRELAGLTRLKKLHLGGTKVTDDGLAQLASLPALETLEFSTGQFTLSRLSQFTQLRELELRDEPITDDDLALIARLTHLRELRITRTHVPQSGLPLHEVVRLAAQKAPPTITDAGLAHLGALKELQRFVLTDAQVTDAGLKHLAGLTRLRSLWLERCGVTAHGIADLETLLPGLRANVPFGGQPFAAQYKVVGLEDARPAN